MSIKMLTHTGSLTLLDIPRSLLARSSVGFSRQDAVAVAMTAESRNVVGRVVMAFAIHQLLISIFVDCFP